MSENDFDGAVRAFRHAQDAFLRGDPAPVLELFSRRDDAPLANPFGPPHVGWTEVAKATNEAAANFTGGSIQFEEVSRYTTPDLGYTVELERIEVQVAGSEDTTPMSLQATMIFRREEDTWKGRTSPRRLDHNRSTARRHHRDLGIQGAAGNPHVGGDERGGDGGWNPGLPPRTRWRTPPTPSP